MCDFHKLELLQQSKILLVNASVAVNQPQFISNWVKMGWALNRISVQNKQDVAFRRSSNSFLVLHLILRLEALIKNQ